MVNKAVNGLGSPLLALVVLGMFKRKLGADGVFWEYCWGYFSVSGPGFLWKTWLCIITR